MLKRWCSTKEIEVYLLCEIWISKDTLQGGKTIASLVKVKQYKNAPATLGCDLCFIVARSNVKSSYELNCFRDRQTSPI